MLLLNYHGGKYEVEMFDSKVASSWCAASCICWEVSLTVINIGNTVILPAVQEVSQSHMWFPSFHWAPWTACHCGQKTSLLSRLSTCDSPQGNLYLQHRIKRDNGVTQQLTTRLTCTHACTCTHLHKYTCIYKCKHTFIENTHSHRLY